MKFFNSDKSGFLSFVAKRMKALFALLFIIAGTSSVWGQSFYVAGNGDGNRGNWCDGQDWNASSSLMTQQGNIYVKQFANLPANDDYQFKIVKDGNWNNDSWGFSNYQSSSDNTNFISGSVSCSDAGGNIKFSLSQTANVTVAFDFTNKHVAVYSSSVEIGLVGSFTDNWNLEQQIKATTDDGVTYTWDLSSSDISLNDSDEFKFISGTTWDNNTNQWGGPLGGAYTIPTSASTDGTIYNVDIIVHHKDCGKVKFDAPLCPVTIQKIELNVLTNDLKITTGESSTNPEPEPVSLYLIGAGTGAQWDLAAALPFTYENGVYTWTGNLTVNNEAFKILTSNTEWEPAYVAETNQFAVVPGVAIDLHYREKSGDNQYTWDDNKFKITEGGEYTIKVTLGADNSSSMIVTKKSDPVYAATITADASASQATARQVVLTSSLTETSASTDLSAATCQFQYLSADAAEGTEYSNLDAPVVYNAEGASLTTTALPQGGKYLFRAVWTLNGEVVATSEPSEATCVYPILPEPEMFDVVWIPTYNTSDGSVTITAEISAKEDACFVMGQIVGLVANIYVDDASQATSMSNPSGAENNKATATATIQNVNEGQELAYRLELTTGTSQQVLGRGGIQIPGGTYVVEGEAYVERFPVTVNTVNGEAGGAVTTEPADIGNMAIDETVTVTATANEGYVALFEATSGCVMTDGSADNIKVFEITEANPVITVTFQVQCETVKPGFTISGQFNAGMDSPWVGTPINSREDDPADGCFAGGDEGDTNLFDARKFTLTANSVPANYFLWECAGYALDGTSMDIPEITWANKASQSATATVNLPGTYTFRLKAKCNESDEWINSADLTITAPVPQIGFDGEDGNIGDWQHAWAGQGGLMTRQSGTLTWKSNAFTLGNLASEFVIIQRYKLGCVGDLDGWDGYQDNGCDYHGNKINYADLELNGINGGTGGNFSASNTDAWVANETQLQLTVTMRDWDSYTVELAKKQEQIYAYYSSNDVTKGTVAMKVGDTPIANGADITAYIGQEVTLTATPALGYKVASWDINGKVTESDRATISPTLSGEGLNVVVTFERDCYSGVVYDLTGGGIICADGGSTELSLNTLNNVTYQLYKDGEVYVKAVPVQGNGAATKWTISEAGTYTAKAYDSRFAECKEQAIDMKGSAVVTSVTAPKIKVNPGDNVHLTVLQARSFTADVPVDWSIRSLPADTGGDYCKGDGYMISSQTDTSLVAKFLCVGTAKITATMKDPNQNCMAEVTVTQNAAETEACAPEPEDMQ